MPLPVRCLVLLGIALVAPPQLSAAQRPPASPPATRAHSPRLFDDGADYPAGPGGSGGQALPGLADLGAPPANDNFANATILITSPSDYIFATINGDNLNATKEPGEPDHGGNAGGHSVWWKWTAPENLRVSLYSSNSDFDTALAVYTGSAVNALIPILSDPFTAPEAEAVFFDATVGTTYYIAVDGIAGRSGNIQLSLVASAATLPFISSQSGDTTVTAGRNFYPILQVTAGGSPVLSYQWFHNNVPIDQANSAALLILHSITASDAGSYYVVVANSWGTAASATVTVTVTDVTPVITAQPTNLSLTVGQTATFTVAATGGLLSYQWAFNGTAIAGATGSTLNVPNIQAGDAGLYSVTVSSVEGSVTSTAAQLFVFPVATRPVITAQPVSQTVNVGASVSFSVTATGYPTVTGYQWLYNGTSIANATDATYSLGNVQTANSGSYSVNVINPLGTTTSNTATLAVNVVVLTPPPTTTPSSGGSGGGGGGGGAPSGWFLASLSALVMLKGIRRLRHERPLSGD